MNKFVSYKNGLTQNARKLRKNLTEPEKRVWNILRSRRFHGFKFLRQKPLEKYIVDFYCPELLLAIEIDGDSHDEQINYDYERTKVLNNRGIFLVRYANSEVMKNIEGIYENLELHIRARKSKPTHTLPCQGGKSDTLP